MRRRVISAACIWLAGVLTLGAGAQEPTFRAGTELVRVDVLASAHGQPVRDLTIADFEVRDQGVVQQIEFVRFEQLPLNIVFVCDMSGSVSGNDVEHMRRAVSRVLAGLTRGDRVALVTFGRRVTERISLTEDTDAITAGLLGLQPQGLTPLIDGVYAGVRLTATEPGRSIILVFSDGIDTTSWLSAARVMDTIRSSDTTVYGVSIGTGKHDFLRDVAEASGGRHAALESTAALQATFGTFLDEFRRRYVLGYSPSEGQRTGWHRLDVKVRRPGVDVKARPGYLVVK